MKDWIIHLQIFELSRKIRKTEVEVYGSSSLKKASLTPNLDAAIKKYSRHQFDGYPLTPNLDAWHKKQKRNRIARIRGYHKKKF